MDKKKETPFQIKIPKEKQKQMAKDLENVDNLKSAIHFVKNYKNCIIVNKKFKRKVVNFSIKSVASISAIVIAISLIKQMNKDNNTTDITPVETNITIETNNNIPGPILSEKTLEEMNNVDLNKDIVDVSNNEEYDTTNEIAYDYSMPTTTIEFPKASDTNIESDYKNYIKVQEKYGLYIDKIARESGVDSRIIIAMIAQENPNQIDETNLGTYGPMCVTSVHDGETYNYYHYNENGDYVNEKVTIDIDNLKSNDKNNQIYLDGQYGNITNADAWCIYYGTIILKENYNQIDKANPSLTPEEKVPLAIAAYNHGYPDVIRNTKYSTDLFDASYSIRYSHAGDSRNDDDQYIEHVLNKIPDDELYKPFIFVDNNENIISFNLERNNEISTVSATPINKDYTL